jgi:hypothetical protein
MIFAKEMRRLVAVSQRQVAKEFGISRVTVRKYLEESVPVRKEMGPRARPVWEKVEPRIETLLAASAQWTAGKQQLTATRLHELLIGEGHRVGVTLVKEAVAEWKRQRREVFVPLTYRPGDLAEALGRRAGPLGVRQSQAGRRSHSRRGRASTLEAINQALLAGMDARLETGRDVAGETIGTRFATETVHFRPLPAPFVAEATTIGTVSPRALVRLEGAVYSVPTRWAGLDLVARIGATRVTIVGRDGTRVVHPRKRFGQRSIDYRHYLPELARKPQAVRQVLPDLLRDLGAPFPAVWEHFHAAHAPREAARLFAKVLGQLDTHGFDVVVPAVERALRTGTPVLLALTPGAEAPARLQADVVPAGLRDLDVPSGCAADYDGWLAEAV